MKRTLTIKLQDDVDDEIIVARVLELVSDGYTSGFHPYWEIKETDPAIEAADKLKKMESALRQLSGVNLNDDNCAGWDVANTRIRNIANLALI